MTKAHALEECTAALDAIKQIARDDHDCLIIRSLYSSMVLKLLDSQTVKRDSERFHSTNTT